MKNRLWARVADNPAVLAALIAVQSLCAAFFIWDVIEDVGGIGLGALTDPYFATESAAALSLASAVAGEAHFPMRLMRRHAHLREQVSIAPAALHEVMPARFEERRLTAAESAVAPFAIKGIKGMSTAGIACLRGSAEGTLKARLNALCRKAGVAVREALLGLLVGELPATPLIAPAGQGPAGQGSEARAG